MTISIQQCDQCGAWNVPSRHLCGTCLSDALAMQDLAGTGQVVASAEVHVSLVPDFLMDGPFGLATVQIDLGPAILAASRARLAPGARVRLSRQAGPQGMRWWAEPEAGANEP